MSLFATEGRFFLFGESSVEVVVTTFSFLVAVYVFVEWLLSFGICFQRFVIDHGHTLTVIRQQSSCPNMNTDGEEALMYDAVHLSNGVSHLLVGSEKGSEDHASILLPCLVRSHDPAIDKESAIVFVVNEAWSQSSIPHDGIFTETVLDVDSIVDDGKAGTSVVADSHGGGG